MYCPPRRDSHQYNVTYCPHDHCELHYSFKVTAL